MKTVEQDGGALRVDAVASEGGDQEGDGDLDGLDVFEWREVELEGDGFGEILWCFGGGCWRVGVVWGQNWCGFNEMSVATEESGVKVTEGGASERG